MSDERTLEAENAAIVAVVREVATEIVDELGLELVEVESKGPAGRRVVRIVVDGDHGVDVDAIATLSRGVSEQLDEDDERIPGAWTLEVTSPGVDRPLTRPAHWTRNVGRDVHVEHGTGDGTRQTTGRLAEATDTHAVVNVKGRMVTIAFEDVERAKVVLPW